MMTKLIGLVAMGIVLPSIFATNNNALAKEVRVNTNKVEAVTRSDGSIYINSGDTTVKLPSRRAWNPWRSWRLPWQDYSNTSSGCRHSSYQSTSRVTASSSTIVQSSVSRNTCN